jgi:hypothetical protein
MLEATVEKRIHAIAHDYGLSVTQIYNYPVGFPIPIID